jgi:NitT/TauT family transport system substrate-binding protein
MLCAMVMLQRNLMREVGMAVINRRNLIAVAFACALAAGPAHAQKIEKLRVGHFPNITHVQALVAHHFSRKGEGWFEKRVGLPVEWYIYNAGPSAMEAIFAKSIDLTYVGPSPALNAFARSNGEEVRLLAGAATGGAALVVQPDQNLAKPEDFKGKVVATPQLGNTQDISARAWFAKAGVKVTLTGGELKLLPTANPDQLQLFVQKKLDAVWTVEPWVSRLEDAGGKVVLEEQGSTTTVLAARRAFLTDAPEIAKKIAAAHRELTEWIKAHPQETETIVRAELELETRAPVSEKIARSALKRITLDDKIDLDDLKNFVAHAQAAGLMKQTPDLGRLVEQPR